MAADVSLAVSEFAVPDLGFDVPQFTYIAVQGFDITTLPAIHFGGSGGGATVRPSSGFIYPRGDS